MLEGPREERVRTRGTMENRGLHTVVCMGVIPIRVASLCSDEIELGSSDVILMEASSLLI